MAMSKAAVEFDEFWSNDLFRHGYHSHFTPGRYVLRSFPSTSPLSLSLQGKTAMKAVSEGSSYLDMWKRAKERHEQELLQTETQRKETDPQQQKQLTEDKGVWDEKTQRFSNILQVPAEERDRVQRMQVIDRAAAALAAVNALLSEQASFRNTAATLPASYAEALSEYGGRTFSNSSEDRTEPYIATERTLGAQATPGPDFWTWSPPVSEISSDDSPLAGLQRLRSESVSTKSTSFVLEKEPALATLNIPMESQMSSSVLQQRAKPSLPPLQSLLQIEDKVVAPSEDVASANSNLLVPDLGLDIASFVQQESLQNTSKNHGVNQDGSRWWKETGEELRSSGVTCLWTVIRGINVDGTEWEEKFWEAFDDLDYKELGAEKSGRDATGNVWREFWKESMWQDLSTGLLHMEKTADKWARNGLKSEWHEKWWEHYDASGFAEKWADKWCKIDERTILEPGHGHIWHERWGEKFDGQGAAMKYTDKWAERAEYGGGRSKWGDKWDESFNKFGNGVKQGETWWEGPSGERWNRTWGEEHNGSGWVHKYGKSSCGEHWDTHEQQDTWYERHPHYGFHHCLENSQELQCVGSRRNSN